MVSGFALSSVGMFESLLAESGLRQAFDGMNNLCSRPYLILAMSQRRIFWATFRIRSTWWRETVRDRCPRHGWIFARAAPAASKWMEPFSLIKFQRHGDTGESESIFLRGTDCRCQPTRCVTWIAISGRDVPFWTRVEPFIPRPTDEREQFPLRRARQ